MIDLALAVGNSSDSANSSAAHVSAWKRVDSFYLRVHTIPLYMTRLSLDTSQIALIYGVPLALAASGRAESSAIAGEGRSSVAGADVRMAYVIKIHHLSSPPNPADESRWPGTSRRPPTSTVSSSASSASTNPTLLHPNQHHKHAAHLNIAAPLRLRGPLRRGRLPAPLRGRHPPPPRNLARYAPITNPSPSTQPNPPHTRSLTAPQASATPPTATA